MTSDDATTHPADENPFGEIIHRYTRAEAIADGVLVDITSTAQEAGFRWPTAITVGAWSKCVAWDHDDGSQDEAGRLWDVVWMARATMLSLRRVYTDWFVFEVYVVPAPGRSARPETLSVHVGPGDHDEPVITILLPGED